VFAVSIFLVLSVKRLGAGANRCRGHFGERWAVREAAAIHAQSCRLVVNRHEFESTDPARD
jgi:hypothetical protein